MNKKIIGFELTKHNKISFRFENEKDLIVNKQYFIDKVSVNCTEKDIKSEVKNEIKRLKEKDPELKIHRDLHNTIIQQVRNRLITKKKIEDGTKLYEKYLKSIQDFLNVSYKSIATLK